MTTDAQQLQNSANIYDVQKLEGNIIGRGSFAQTYRVFDPRTGHRALKSISLRNPITSPVLTLDMLEAEVSILQSLDHRNIVRYFGHYFAFTADRPGTPSAFDIVTEFVDGCPLATILDRLLDGWPPLEVSQLLKWARQMASALEYMHAQCIYHRDLKHDNVMVTCGGDIKMIDFGQACRSATEGAFVTDRTGTPDYASYQKYKGLPNDGRDDVWGMGCMLLELLLGKM